MSTTFNPAAHYRRNLARTTHQLGAPSVLDLLLRHALPDRVTARLYPASFNPNRPYLVQVAAATWHGATRTALRRWTLAPLLVALIHSILVNWLFPAQAYAASPMYLMGVTDSYGVNLGLYGISTDFGSVIDPGNTILASLFSIFGYMYIQTVGFFIWLVCWVLSFQFVRDMITPFADAAQTSVAHFLLPLGGAAATIAATVAAFAVFRGQMAKAGKYAASSVLVAMFATAIFTATPITWTLSDKGPLVAGRDFGISMATNSAPNTTANTDTVTKLRGELITNFVRRPVQMWNFNAVVDDTPACAAAWSAGVNSGNTDNIKNGVRDCGAPNSRAMKHAADNPGWDQVVGGTAVFAILGLAIVLFCGALSGAILMTCIRAVIEAFKLTFSMVIAVIPGAPQILFLNISMRLLFTFISMTAFVMLALFSSNSVVLTLNTNISRGIMYATIVAGISMFAMVMAGFMIRRNVDNAANSAAAAIARSTDNTSAIIQPGSTVNHSGALPALAGAAVGYAAKAVKYPGQRQDRALARERTQTQIIADRTQAHANAANAGYLSAITPRHDGPPPPNPGQYILDDAEARAAAAASGSSRHRAVAAQEAKIVHNRASAAANAAQAGYLAANTPQDQRPNPGPRDAPTPPPSAPESAPQQNQRQSNIPAPSPVSAPGAPTGPRPDTTTPEPQRPSGNAAQQNAAARPVQQQTPPSPATAPNSPANAPTTPSAPVNATSTPPPPAPPAPATPESNPRPTPPSTQPTTERRRPARGAGGVAPGPTPFTRPEQPHPPSGAGAPPPRED